MLNAQRTGPAGNGTSGTTRSRPLNPAVYVMKARGQTQPRRVKTPNCTHIDMDRVYDRELHCFVCGRQPAIGFLYECRQDCGSHPFTTHDGLDVGYGPQTGPESLLSQLELQEVGLSESVITTAEQGGYTDTQLIILKKQKLELRQAIEDTIQARNINSMAAKLAAPLATSNTDGTFHSAPREESPVPTCCFRACHTCRPYYRDRIYISITALFTPSCPAPVTFADAEHLPTKDARKLRNIGLFPNPSPPPPQTLTTHETTTPSTVLTSTDLFTDNDASPSRSSVITFKTTQTDISVLRRIRHPRRRFYHLGSQSSGSIARDLASRSIFSRQGLKSAIQGVFKTSRDSSSTGSSISNITLPLSRTGTARNLTVGDSGEKVGEFDVGSLRRVRRQKERVDLRNGTFVGGFETGERIGETGAATVVSDEKGKVKPKNLSGHGEISNTSIDSESTDSEYSVYSCASKGSEVEVSGGVALTEEAVETHTPDILNTGIDMGEPLASELESIMTQA